MRKELPHFEVGSAYGGSQDWFSSPMMRLGGCAAATACDCAIYFDRYMGTHLYPFDQEHVSKKDYVAFSNIMKPYLRPRMTGIDRLEIFIDGVDAFLANSRERDLRMIPFDNGLSLREARAVVIRQIDAGFPIPYLNLHHSSRNFKFYEWHWFLLNGYEFWSDTLMVKAVTYGSWNWLDFDALWETGRTPKGGMILWSKKQ